MPSRGETFSRCCERKVDEISGAETFRDRTEGLVEGKPSLGEANGKVEEISGAETFRDRAEVVGNDSREGKPSLDEQGANPRERLLALRARRKARLTKTRV